VSLYNNLPAEYSMFLEMFLALHYCLSAAMHNSVRDV